MLLIKTEVRPSKFGLGLFTLEPIKTNDIVWKYDITTEIVVDLYENCPQSFKDFVTKYGYEADGIGIVVNLDNARFMNHSDCPNLSEIDGCNYAIKDIDIGEELTCDYRVFDSKLSLCGDFLRSI